MGGGSPRDERCHRHQYDHEDRGAQAEHGPVEVDAFVGIDRPHRSQGSQGRQADRHDQGHRGAQQHGGDHPDQPVARCLHGAGPEGSEHGTLLCAQPELAADDLAGDQKGGQGDDRPERSQGDGFRLDGALRLGHDLGVAVDERRKCRREESGDLADDGGDIAGPALHLYAALGIVDAALEQLARQGGGEEVVGRAALVDVVLHDGVVEDGDAHHLFVHDPHGLDRGRAEGGQLGLGVGVDAHGKHAPHVHVERGGALGAQHQLIGIARVRHAALGHRHLVLVEVQAVDAAVAVARGRRIEVGGIERRAVGLQGEEVDSGLAFHRFDVREPGDLLDQCRLVSRVVAEQRVEQPVRADQVRGVGAGPERGE